MRTGVRIAVGCATGLVAAAGAVLVYDVTRGDEPVAAADVTPSITASPSPSPSRTPTVSPSDSAPTTPSAPTQLAGPAPLTAEASQAVLPQAGGAFVAAEVPVELTSVCAGAAPNLTGATPLYVSLQTSAAPLRFLDVAVAVYATSDDAVRAYERLAEDVAACPPSRSVTPAPAPGEAVPPPILVEGERRDVAVAERPAIQWVQVQTVQAPATQLRTAVTVSQVHNVLVMVSVDGDSETAEAAAIATDSLTHADAIVTALVELVG